ncbi:TPA_asm: hypothetical protein G0G78_26365, partial [Salmonella enterica]|nr:hypothetical protein [Salmonella enterica]HAC8273452.1 hypothetical protein [Salmonella enterica]
QQKRHQTWILIDGLLKYFAKDSRTLCMSVSGRCLTMCHNEFSLWNNGEDVRHLNGISLVADLWHDNFQAFSV